MILVLAFLVLLGLPAAASGAPRSDRGQERFTGAVIKVTDGDTLKIRKEDGHQVTCRLYGIDAPETAKRGKPGQPGAEEAAKALEELVYRKSVEVETTGRQTYRREVCRIRVGGVDVNLEMVRRGHAWAYVEYLRRPHASEYLDAERMARQEHVGIWSDPKPNPPWEFRAKVKRAKRESI